MEAAWLLDDGLMCLGAFPNGCFEMVPYTSPHAIHFTSEEDAQRCRHALLSMDGISIDKRCRPMEHQWSA